MILLNQGRKNTGDIIYSQLKEEIIFLEYKPNERLSEAALAKQLGVSRTPLRQALARLELERLVIRKGNGRMYVTPLSIQEAIEIYKVREVLEGLIAKEATLQATDEMILKMEDTLSLMSRASEQGRGADIADYGFEFHYILYDQSENPTAVNFLNQIKTRIERYRQIGEDRHSRYVNHLPIQEHEYIFELIKKGEAEQVELEMRRHIKRSLDTTVESLKAMEYTF